MRRHLLIWIVVAGLSVAGIGQTLTARAKAEHLAALLDAERAERAKVTAALEFAIEQARGDVFRLRVAVLDATNETRVTEARVLKLERWRRQIFP